MKTSLIAAVIAAPLLGLTSNSATAEMDFGFKLYASGAYEGFAACSIATSERTAQRSMDRASEDFTIAMAKIRTLHASGESVGRELEFLAKINEQMIGCAANMILSGWGDESDLGNDEFSNDVRAKMAEMEGDQ